MSTDQTFKSINGVYTGPEHWKGSLTLKEYKDTITSLGNLKTVEGSLYLKDCTSLTSLGNIESVGETLYLYECKGLKTLGGLKTVGQWGGLRDCTSLTSLGNLKTVRRDIYLLENKRILLKEVQNKIKYYSSLPAHEALNAIHSKDAQEIPLYRNILTEILQKGIIQKAPLYKRIQKYLPSWIYIKKEK